MNILLTSVGRRSYLVKYFKAAIGNEGEVHVSNSDSMTPAFMYADKSIVTPLIHNDEYIPFLLEYCKKNKISAIISLFDIDLPVLSANKKYFESNGIKVIVSNEDTINICNDKWKTYKFLINNGFNAPKTYIDIEAAIEAIKEREIEYPLIIKPRWGMGSIGVFEAENEKEMRIIYKKAISSIKSTYLKYNCEDSIDNSIIIQQKLKGQEYGLDIINDLNGKYQNTIVKKKYTMRSGETDCAETINNDDLKEIGRKISEKLKHIANMDIDIFFDGKVFYILELNARFGGGYPFSHIAGVNLPLAIVKWINSETVNIDLLTEKIGVKAHKEIEIIQICQ